MRIPRSTRHWRSESSPSEGLRVEGRSGGLSRALAYFSTPRARPKRWLHTSATRSRNCQGARITRVNELQDKIIKGVIVDVVCDPVLVEQAADMLAPCGAGRRERGTCGSKGASVARALDPTATKRARIGTISAPRCRNSGDIVSPAALLCGGSTFGGHSLNVGACIRK